jgi:hypothetical protein
LKAGSGCSDRNLTARLGKGLAEKRQIRFHIRARSFASAGWLQFLAKSRLD